MINPADITYFSFDKAGNLQLSASNDATVWVAHALINTSNKDNINNHSLSPKNQRKLQRQAIRQLLRFLVKHIYPNMNLTTVSLDESRFPYILSPLGYFVCFSHSKNNIVCVICKHSPIGIDIEVNPVSYHLAKRFFHPDEITWLSNLDKHLLTLALNILWTLKESYIKQSSSHIANTLTAGLKYNFAATAMQMLDQFETIEYHSSKPYLKDIIPSTTNNTAHIALYLPAYKMAVIY